MNTKSPFKSVTVWGAVVTALFGLLSVFGIEIAPGEAGEVTNALGVIVGFAVTLFGRIRAKIPVKFGGGAANVMLTVCLLSATFPLSGCNWFSPSQKEQLTEVGVAAGKIAASALINIGLQELGSRVNELQPYIGPLQSVITFAPADATPEQLAGEIETYLARDVPDPAAADIIRAAVLDSLDEGTATASGPEPLAERSYIARLRNALQSTD